MKRTHAMLADLLAMLPADTRQIADGLGVSRELVRTWLRQLRAGGVITYASKVGRFGCRLVLLCPSVPFQRCGSDGSATVQRFVAVWDALASRQTIATLSDRTGIHKRSAGQIVSYMRASGLLRVAAWQVNGQTFTPIYDRLQGADAPRPARKPREQSNAEYWAKRRLSASRAGCTASDRRSVQAQGAAVGAMGHA